MSDEATITRYPQAVEETPTMVLRFIERAIKDHPENGRHTGWPDYEHGKVLVLQQQWKVRDLTAVGPGPWRFEWRDVVFDPHGG